MIETYLETNNHYVQCLPTVHMHAELCIVNNCRVRSIRSVEIDRSIEIDRNRSIISVETCHSAAQVHITLSPSTVITAATVSSRKARQIILTAAILFCGCTEAVI